MCKLDRRQRRAGRGKRGKADRRAPNLTTALLLSHFIPSHSQKVSTALFFKWNSQLGPPYQVLVDTNFINFAIKNKVRE